MGEPQSFHDNLFKVRLSVTSYQSDVGKYRMENATICPHRCIHRMSNYNNLIHSHGGIIIGDFDTLEKKVIHLENSIVPETFDLVED
jgi:hypothetical protein